MTQSIQSQSGLSAYILISGTIMIWSAVALSITFSQSLLLQLAFLILLLLALFLFFRQSMQDSQQIKHALGTMAAQFQNINDGKSERLELEMVPESLQPLLSQVQTHLSMETDRLIQEQNFSSDASHELRTPLAGMRLQAQIAQRAKDDQQRTRALDNIIKAVDRSTRMVEQLLNYSRLSRRRAQAEQSRVNITEMCRQTIAKYASKVAEKQLNLEVIFDEGSEIVLDANKDQMAALMSNAIQNAIEHTPEKGKLRVALKSLEKQEDNEILLVVEDSGPGIAESDRDRVIVPFQRSSDGKQKGTGLGLAICTRVVQLHRGSLSLDNSELGGLRLQASLPQLKSMAPVC